MRKAQKEQAEHIIQLLDHVHEGIKKAVEKGQYDDARELLSQCQESAIELGETIEEIEGEGFVTVSYLEHYCEAVYRAYTLLGQVQGVNAAKLHKNLRRALISVENSVKNDIRVRTEAVFLPYKASMWDSLESVWKAADEDPDCDAYVIPIPYFDKNPDGSFREMHYEGDLYPEYVPVTRYEGYDFAERHPDMIFIHNPYDNCNYVTSVHPFFYSSNLKNFTDKLVYIPYFILQEIDPDNKVQTEGMVNYCVVPGVINADKVIVQSEAMRQVYIKVLMENTEGGDRKYWEEKILGLGSPKVDKVLSTRKEDLEIPEEWRKIIEKPDGSWKKIIFYNTGITGLLQNDEKMLRKMKDVFRVFKENQDEVALLWRPHPLIKATIESMRPQLWEEYKEIVEEYRSEGWGIYDDSADMDRAVAVCDGYYGDHSSLVRLCQEAGKPVMIQDVETVFQGEFPISFDCTYQENNDIWFVGNKDNSLWNMKLDTKQLKYVALIPSNSENMFRRNTRCIKYENRIFCLPDLDDKIAIYDIYTNKFKYCEIGGKSEERRSIYNAWVYGSTLWCISYYMQQIIEIDLSNINVKGMYPVFGKPDQIIGYESTIHEGNIYFVSRNDTVIGKFNLLTKEIRYYKLDINDKGFNTIATDGHDFYMTGYKKAIYIWNENTNQIKTEEEFPCEYEVLNLKKESIYYDSPIFYRSIAAEKYVLFLPWNFPDARSNGMLLYDKIEQKVLFIKDEEHPENQSIPLYCVGYCTLNNTVGIFSIWERSFIEIDREYQITYPRGFEISGYKSMFFDMDWERKVLQEQRKSDLKVWLGLIWNKKNRMSKKFDMQSGKLIWNII